MKTVLQAQESQAAITMLFRSEVTNYWWQTQEVRMSVKEHSKTGHVLSVLFIQFYTSSSSQKKKHLLKKSSLSSAASHIFIFESIAFLLEAKYSIIWL